MDGDIGRTGGEGSIGDFKEGESGRDIGDFKALLRGTDIAEIYANYTATTRDTLCLNNCKYADQIWQPFRQLPNALVKFHPSLSSHLFFLPTHL